MDDCFHASIPSKLSSQDAHSFFLLRLHPCIRDRSFPHQWISSLECLRPSERYRALNRMDIRGFCDPYCTYHTEHDNSAKSSQPPSGSLRSAYPSVFVPVNEDFIFWMQLLFEFYAHDYLAHGLGTLLNVNEYLHSESPSNNQ